MARNLGPYEIRSELGRGAMAIVWRAYDPALDREVALKEEVVPHGTDAVNTAELATRFVREARIAAGLSHPGIVAVYAADIYDKSATIAMELIQGETLTTAGPATTTTSTAPPTTATTAAPTRWYVRVYNVDDQGTAIVNGSTVATVWSDVAGQVGVSGANGGDSSRTHSMVYDRTISLQ